MSVSGQCGPDAAVSVPYARSCLLPPAECAAVEVLPERLFFGSRFVRHTAASRCPVSREEGFLAA